MKPLYEFLFKPKTKLNRLIAFLLLALTAAFGAYELLCCLKLVRSFPSTMDTQLFMTVGRAVGEGMTPYADMYENKPPAIFWLSALSYRFCGDTRLLQLLSFCCTAATGLIPIIACFFTLRKSPSEKGKSRAVTAAFIMFGFVISIFCDYRAGRGRVEGFGAFLISLYLLFVYLINSEKLKIYSWQPFLMGFTAMSGIMFKEPFVFVAIAGALILCETKKDYIYKLILPLIYGGIMGVALLAATGTLSAYLEIYLKYMLGTHISVYGSVWVRGLNIHYPVLDILFFDPIFQAVICLMFFFVIAMYFKKADLKAAKGKLYVLFSVSKLILALYLVSLAVGAGGQYFRHHFVFSAPFYIALSLFLLRTLCVPFLSKKSAVNAKKLESCFKRTLSLFLVLCMCSVVMLPFTADYSNKKGEWIYVNNISKKQAEYVDGILDVTNEDSYQFIGFAGEIFFYEYTEKLPKGPVFVQDKYNFEKEGWFTENLLNQLEEVNIVIYHKNETGVIYDKVENILNTEFTTEPPEGIEELEKPVYFPYTVYYRQ